MQFMEHLLISCLSHQHIIIHKYQGANIGGINPLLINYIPDSNMIHG